MKWPTLLLICAIAFGFNACQRHGAEELKQLQPAHEAKDKTATEPANH